MAYLRDGSGQEDSSFPAIILSIGEAFIPGLGVVNEIASSYFQIDLTYHIIVVFGILAVLTVVSYLLSTIWSWLYPYVVVSAEIRYEDEMWNFVMFWITKQKFSRKTTSFVASIKTTSASVLIGEDSDDDDDKMKIENENMKESGYDPKVQSKMKTIHFTPASGFHIFSYNGRLFFLRRCKNKSQALWIASEAETIYISTIGRNTEPIKRLLQEAQIQYYRRDKGKTVMYRPAKRRSSGRSTWTRYSSRPSRPMSTVILDKDQKEKIINDMEEYLSCASQPWYTKRGIPYRRGYLFHGPPGTGKTSLCSALAGHLNLSIYIVLLGSVSEDDFDALFAKLPSRCIVLLEDIDSAGIAANRAQIKGGEAETEQDIELVLDTRAAKSTNRCGITLSGLLNIIDRRTAQDGRILIMTTNHPERLDPAIRRPGRVDLTINFPLANHEMIKRVFQATYMKAEGETGEVDGNDTEISTHQAGRTTHSSSVKGEEKRLSNPLESEEEIKILADRFADQVPVSKFTIAEIQGFLLRNKNNPKNAVGEATKFFEHLQEEEKEEKEKKKMNTNKENMQKEGAA